MCDPILLQRGLEALDLALPQTARENLLVYCRDLLKWNRRINLVARNTTQEEALEKHFLDSLTLLPLVNRYAAGSQSLLDVGTGGGFPGLVLAAVQPELQVILVEPRQKRVSFLRHIIRTLGLANVDLHAARLEEIDWSGRCPALITSRAVAEARRFLTMIAPVAGPETRVLLMQGAGDISGDVKFFRQQGWHLLESTSLHLPFSGVSRHLSVLGQNRSA